MAWTLTLYFVHAKSPCSVKFSDVPAETFLASENLYGPAAFTNTTYRLTLPLANSGGTTWKRRLYMYCYISQMKLIIKSR